MKKFLTVWGLLLFISITSYSQEKKYALYSVAFYNLENLFDTIHDAGKNDFEYLPNGKNKWNSMKSVSYTHLDVYKRQPISLPSKTAAVVFLRPATPKYLVNCPLITTALPRFPSLSFKFKAVRTSDPPTRCV